MALYRVRSIWTVKTWGIRGVNFVLVAYRYQLHTHTWRCQHATGDAIDYARVAAAGGCRVLGMSDHMPHPDGRWSDVRMALADLPDYEAAVAAARVAEPDLRILIALECEYLPELTAFYQDELLGRRGYDYLIGAGHYLQQDDGRWRGTFDNVRTVASLRRYADLLIAMMEANVFAFIAHPDCVGAGLDAFDAEVAACARDIASAAVATRTPLELNAYGLRKPWRTTSTGYRPGYPWEPFWAVAAEVGVEVILNADAHRPEDVLHGHDELVAIRDRYGLREANPAARISTCTAQLFSQYPPP